MTRAVGALMDNKGAAEEGRNPKEKKAGGEKRRQAEGNGAHHLENK